jgi:dCMP deaminase
MKWDEFFLAIAQTVSEKSKDPSTKVGAVLVDDKKRLVSVGFNGFPRGTEDSVDLYTNPEEKYLRVLHAETNAMLFADRPGVELFVTHPCCSQCMAMAIQTGIRRINYIQRPMKPNWEQSFKVSEKLADEAGVEVWRYNMNLESIGCNQVAIDNAFNKLI